MDRGAARSRKKAAQAVKAQPTAVASQAPAQAGPSSTSKQRDGPGPSRRKERPPRPEKPVRGAQSTDPSLYRPKAIRTAAALIYSQAPFDLPPSSEQLAAVRRVDLAGSGATEVSWLEGTGVTWLNLAGCRIEKGWEAVGSLQDLTVLNISGCGLTLLPPALAKLSKLKAIVAMNNDWTQLDQEVIAGWKDLNSLIISHSPNLTSLPPTLASLPHLSKLTFSHCPRLTAASLPDLSSLPLLRDVKMNNLPQLTSLPAHLSSWGKGDLSLVGKGKDDTTRLGDGLEVLDLGNCSLPYSAISSIFGLTSTPGRKKLSLPHLRSLSLHSNPLGSTHPNYAELLQASADLPKLQIIDAKRVVERKRKGEIAESRSDKKARERKEGKMKPSGANVGGTKMRSWGAVADGSASEGEDGVGSGGDDDDDDDKDGKAAPRAREEIKARKEKKRAREVEQAKASSKKRKHHHEEIPKVASAAAGAEQAKKRSKRSSPPPHAAPSAAATVAAQAKPSNTSESIDAIRSQHVEVSTTERDKSGKVATGLVGVIDVKDGEEVELTSKKKKKLKAKIKKGAEVQGGVDLKELFGKKAKADEEKADMGAEDDGLGLGVGGW
ncbi:hypothetical protein IAU60_005558 [Kwoniella sp. DSM 27419]